MLMWPVWKVTWHAYIEKGSMDGDMVVYDWQRGRPMWWVMWQVMWILYGH
jgi:hypothetical protein